MNQNILQVLYVGPLIEGGTCRHRLGAIKDLGHKVSAIDTAGKEVSLKRQRYISRFCDRIFGPLDFAKVNEKIIFFIKQNKIDIIWVDKGITIFKKTLEEVKDISPNTIIAHYNPDDPFGRASLTGKGWRHFFKAIPVYDIHFVPRKINIEEYRKHGARKVVFYYKSFDPEIHRPIAVSPEDRSLLGGLVGFIGEYEKERAESLLYLAQNGISVTIIGKSWEKCPFSHPNLKIKAMSLWNTDYAKAICSFDIVLAFLRKANRDQHTSRSLEIPACGAFMLAERTDEHKELYVEGVEAEYFSNNEELLKKVSYYLEHPEERKQIAAQGLNRCHQSGYSNRNMLKKLLELSERAAYE